MDINKHYLKIILNSTTRRRSRRFQLSQIKLKLAMSYILMAQSPTIMKNQSDQECIKTINIISSFFFPLIFLSAVFDALPWFQPDSLTYHFFLTIFLPSITTPINLVVLSLFSLHLCVLSSLLIVELSYPSKYSYYLMLLINPLCLTLSNTVLLVQLTKNIYVDIILIGLIASAYLL